ncbi:cytochrome b5-like heme/steroid binding domain-containing protein [Gloeocapsopsis dulcis]|uniref:cytochrome b5-like heme/steroid binding domain-containing protein n=1 Tax=Gloeocapsopsis dulcis TaxID=2859516 RepID=UPI001F169F27|nr:cytochrome b5-like heme/steroid binding domain-containing protein [Gloeocapsopsis dulcis]WNN90208.1 cytochrome b5-like heme/steroid binding domain-containing protein [Gloeocapsopsis dulcis]
MNAISQIFKYTQFKLKGNEASESVADEHSMGDRSSKPANLSGSPEFASKNMPNVWIYDGEAYDLSDFVKKHPGGEFFIGRMKNRDITALVNIFQYLSLQSRKS